MDQKETLNMKIVLEVTGKETVRNTLEYENTDPKTVLLIEKGLADFVGGIIEAQIKGEI